MPDQRTALILTLVLTAGLCQSCGEKGNNAVNADAATTRVSNNSANQAQTNVEELGMLVNVPYETEDIAWKADIDQKRVIAVMRFSGADADRIVAEAGDPGSTAGVSIAAETWFPSELIAQSEASGDNALKGIAYPANKFYSEPYTNGRIVRVEGTDYFILELSAR